MILFPSIDEFWRLSPRSPFQSDIFNTEDAEWHSWWESDKGRPTAENFHMFGFKSIVKHVWARAYYFQCAFCEYIRFFALTKIRVFPVSFWTKENFHALLVFGDRMIHFRFYYFTADDWILSTDNFQMWNN